MLVVNRALPGLDDALSDGNLQCSCFEVALSHRWGRMFLLAGLPVVPGLDAALLGAHFPAGRATQLRANSTAIRVDRCHVC